MVLQFHISLKYKCCLMQFKTRFGLCKTIKHKVCVRLQLHDCSLLALSLHKQQQPSVGVQVMLSALLLARAQSNPACIINCKLREVKSLMCVCAERKEWRQARAQSILSQVAACVWVSWESARGLFMARFWVRDRAVASGELSKQPDCEKVVSPS